MGVSQPRMSNAVSTEIEQFLAQAAQKKWLSKRQTHHYQSMK